MIVAEAAAAAPLTLQARRKTAKHSDSSRKKRKGNRVGARARDTEQNVGRK